MGSSQSPRFGWSRRIIDVVGAACAAILAFTAVPIVLVVIVGNPLDGGLGHDWRGAPGRRRRAQADRLSLGPGALTPSAASAERSPRNSPSADVAEDALFFTMSSD